jgi:hypothetical protein
METDVRTHFVHRSLQVHGYAQRTRLKPELFGGMLTAHCTKATPLPTVTPAQTDLRNSSHSSFFLHVPNHTSTAVYV